MTQKNSFSADRAGRRPKSLQDYHGLHRRSLEQRETFWSEEATLLDWKTDFSSVVREDFASGEAVWFGGGILEPAANALSRHGDETALVDLAADGSARRLSFVELAALVEQVAAALVASGLASGDRVGLYLSQRVEGVALMLACARQGLTYVPLATGLSAERVRERLEDAGARLLLVDDGAHWPGYSEQRDALVDALAGDEVHIIRTGEASWDAFLAAGGNAPAPAALAAEHPLFILYADSFAGRPRGNVHTAGGFLVQAASGFDLVFQMDAPVRVLSTRSLASAAGQSFGLWGPLLLGHGLVLPPVPESLDAATLRRVAADEGADILLATPRLLAGLLPELDAAPLHPEQRFARVACCGESLTPRVAAALAEHLDAEATQVLNLWVQQESGSPLIAGFPHQDLLQPGSLGLPLPGADLRVLDESGAACAPLASGQLVLAASTPGLAAGVWDQPGRLREIYFERLPGYFHTGDTARVDKEGFFWFMGRLDEVLKIAGQSLSTAEVEGLLAAHPRVAEAVVVGIHGEGGDSLTAFVVSADGALPGTSEAAELEGELVDHLREKVGDFARPERIFVTRELPRTRSGKIVRRLLRRIAVGDVARDEDLDHVANPESVLSLIDSRKRED